MHLTRWFRLILIPLLIALVGLLAACANESTPSTANPFPERQRILLVHSYDSGFRWTAEQGRGIEEGLGAAGLREGLEYELRVFFMDTRVRYTSAEQVDERAAEALAILEEVKPALVFVTDDVALRTVVVPYVEAHPDTGMKFVFSGINVDPTVYPPIRSLQAPGGVVTGFLERIPVADAITAAKRVFPTTSRVALLADGSASSGAAIADFNATYPSGLHAPLDVTGFVQAKTFAEWQQQVRQANAGADLLGLLNYHGLTDGAGKVVASSEVLVWTLTNSTKPVIGLVTDWVSDGMPMAVGNSGRKNGEAAAKIGATIIGGADAGQIAVVDPRLVETAYNTSAIRRLHLEIPEAEIEAAGLVVR